VLARQEGGYLPNQWYQALVRVTYSRVTIEIDGHTLMEVSDPQLAAGGVGVWCDVALPAAPAANPRRKPGKQQPA